MTVSSDLFRSAALASITAAVLTATGPASAQDAWPTRPITMVVGFDAGGSADLTARAVARFMPEEIGQPVLVVNRPGAGSQLAASYVLSRPHDCSTVFFSALSPYLATSILVTNADYTLDDFAYINSQWSDWEMVAVHKDSPYQTLQELLEAAKDNPGKISTSSVFSSSGHLTTLLLLDAFEVPHENVKFVAYDSGGTQRTALAGGTVDFMSTAGDGSEGVRDFIRPLAVMRTERHPRWDAPTMKEALGEIGDELPLVHGAMRGMAVPKGCRDDYPDRYATIVEAYKRTLEREDAKAFMQDADIGHDWIGPDATTAAINDTFSVYERYRDALKQ